MPLISVAIPAYNYARYLPCAIGSVLRQEIDGIDLELVIVDDCSTDDTPQAVAPFLHDTRVRYLRNDGNLGAVRNINKAIAETRGQFVLLLGADDFLLPGCLGALLAALAAHPAAGFAYGNYVVADEDDRILQVIEHPGHIPANLPPWRDDFADLLCLDDYINLGTTLFRRELIERFGFFDPLLTIDEQPGRFFRATDWDLCLRLSLAGIRAAFVYSTLSAFRVHSTQASVGGDFDREGIGLREFTVLLDRYLKPENAWRLAGREAGMRALLQGKIAAFVSQADAAALSDQSALRERIARAEEFLTQLAERSFDEALSPPPGIAAIIVANDNPRELLLTLSDLQQQAAPPEQTLVINCGRMDLSHLVRPARYLQLPGASLPEARHCGVQLTTSAALSFIDAGSRLPPDHVACLAGTLSQAGVVVVQSMGGNGQEGRQANDDAAWRSALAALLPETNPWRRTPPSLSEFALRRHAYHRSGGFDQSLGTLDDLDFLLRLQRGFPIHTLASKMTPVPMLATMLERARESAQADVVARSLQTIAERQPRQAN